MDDREVLKREFETAEYVSITDDTRLECEHLASAKETDEQADQTPHGSTQGSKRLLKKLSLDETEHNHQETLAIMMLKKRAEKRRTHLVVQSLLPGYDTDQVLQAIKKL